MKESDREAIDKKTIRTFGRAALLMALIVLALAVVGMLAEARAESVPQGACQRCSGREALETCLREQWGELRSGTGQDVRGPLVFLFVNRATGTWTIVATMDPGGRFACVLAGGAGWLADTGL